MKSERRTTERLPLKVPAMLSVVDRNGKRKSFEVMTKNICSGGAFLLTDTPQAVGMDITMDLILSFNSFNMNTAAEEKKTHIDLSGTVVRSEKNGMAVCFNKKYSISPFTA